MIKINLLAEGKKSVVRKAAAPAFKLPTTDMAIWIALGMGVVGLLAVGGYWWVLDKQQSTLEGQIQVAQQEVDELKPILAEVEEYKVKKGALEHKIEVINQLKDNQRGPVQIMDQISRALPELLWIERLDLNGSSIALQGRAFNTNAVAAFLENLGKVPEFQEPVLTDTSLTGETYTFLINFTFRSRKPAEAAAGATAGAAGG
jgi:Tfp pilus assembly protein PilN